MIDSIRGFVEVFMVRKALPQRLIKFRFILELAETRITQYYKGMLSVYEDRKWFSLGWVASNQDQTRTTTPSILSRGQEVGEWVRFCIEAVESMQGATYDSIEWWRINSTRYPVIWKKAVMVLSIPITSAAVEQSFAVLRDALSLKRNRLSEESIEVELIVKVNNKQ